MDDGFEDLTANFIGLVERLLNGVRYYRKQAFLLLEHGHDFPAPVVGQDDLVKGHAARKVPQLLSVGLGCQGVVPARVLQEIVLAQVAAQHVVAGRLQSFLERFCELVSRQDDRDEVTHPPVELCAPRAQRDAQTHGDEAWL